VFLSERQQEALAPREIIKITSKIFDKMEKMYEGDDEDEDED